MQGSTPCGNIFQMKPNKKTKLKWISLVLSGLISGNYRFSCHAFEYSGGSDAREWYSETTEKIGELFYLQPSSFGDHDRGDREKALQHRLLWIFWLREMVRNNEA